MSTSKNALIKLINLNKIKKKLNDEHVKFRLKIGFQFALIPLGSIVLAVILNYIVLKVTISLLSTLQSVKSFIAQDLIYLFAEKSLVEILPWTFLSSICLLVIGMTLANIMIRPFRIIGDFCETQLEGEKSSYNPEFIAELKLLSLFSEWFFHTIQVLKKTGSLKKIEVPGKYKKIHKPVFETNFFIHNFLIIIITTLITALLIQTGNDVLFEGVVEVIKEIYPHQRQATIFIQSISEVVSIISFLCIGLNVLFYFVYSFYLYSKVSTPAFGVFATMRSFISGKYSSRVHLIGYSYLRKHTRKLNKYLDYVEKEFSTKDN